MNTEPEPVPEYRAKRTIYIGGTRAFNAGDRVPASHIERHNLGGAVERVDQVDAAVGSVPRRAGRSGAVDAAPE